MGEGGEDYRACRVCTRACQSSHGKDKAAAVPKFHKIIPDTATHSGRSPLLRCPVTFTREHLGDDRGPVILEGASGCEWVVSMYLGGFYGGWKSFAVDHRLEKGDSLMFSLIGARRFTVFVFDKYGIEKVGSISPSRQRRESNRKRKEGLDEESYPEIKKKRKVEPTGLLHESDFLATNSSVSGASSDSGPSGQELVSKAVLAEAKRKKVKKNPKASTMLYGVETPSAFKEFFCGIACAGCPNENRGAPRIGSDIDRENVTTCEVGAAPAENISADTSAGKCRMTPDDVTESQQRDSREEESQELNGVPTRSENLRKHSTRLAEFVARSSKSSQEGIDNSAGRLRNLDGGNVNLVSGRKEISNSVRRSGRRTRGGDTHKELETNQSEGKVKHLKDNIEMQQESLKVLHQEQENFKTRSEQQKGVNHCEQPYPVVSEAMVKEEPVFVDKGDVPIQIPHTHTNPSHNCANCGRTAKLGVGIHLPQPQQAVVKTEEEVLPTKQDAPAVWTNRSLMYSKDGRCSTGRVVTEAQKRKAQDAAEAFSSKTKNPSAVVVMRRSFISGNFKCGLPVCADIFPKAASQIILVDADGYMRSANWRPLSRYMQGPGWRDFVVSHFLEEEDICVMEVVHRSSSLFKVQVHIFRIPQFMHTAQVQGRSISVNANTLVETGHTQRTPSKQHNLSNQKRGRDVDKEDEGGGAKVVARTYTESAETSAMNKFLRAGEASDRVVKNKNKKLIDNCRGLLPEPVERTRSARKLTLKVGRTGMKRAVSQRRSPLISTKRPIPTGLVPVKNTNKQKPERNRVVKSKNEPTKSSTGPKWNSGKLHKVVRLLDRRKGLTGAVFLVELEGALKVSKKGKVKQDESGNWWVPYDQFTSDFLSCYIN